MPKDITCLDDLPIGAEFRDSDGIWWMKFGDGQYAQILEEFRDIDKQETEIVNKANVVLH